jgi:cellulose synthase/poly-beta-1,6-N-acetylglucosamine synthase-like glycosyltransferase
MLRAFRQKWVSKEIGDSRAPIKHLFLQRPVRRRHARPLRDLLPVFSACANASPAQMAGLMTGLIAVAFLAVTYPRLLAQALYSSLWFAFMGNALIRLGACFIPQHRPEATPPPQASNENLPTYSVIVALYKEAAIAPQLVAALNDLTYPRERLEVLFALEADDTETIAALCAQNLPPHMQIVEVPEGFPRTKPRALNHVLGLASGDLVVIYDAEDRPHPDQLLEAARTFSTGPAQLACLQAPLRPFGDETAGTFISRHFTFEYAVQFDVLLPALHAMGLPFPLGGTSNHFKAEVLKNVGGWDAYNVTEDADLGLRLSQFGYLSRMITAPTYETPPATTRTWIPQRARWIKGYIQTLMVHSRLETVFRPRAWLSLLLGVGFSTAASLCYAPFLCLSMLSFLLPALQNLHAPQAHLEPPPIMDTALFLIGFVSAVAAMTVAAVRTGHRLRLRDFLSLPAYWCLQSVAAGFALYQLAVRPFHWDKTDHSPAASVAHKPLYAEATADYGQGHDHHGFRHDLAHDRLG